MSQTEMSLMAVAGAALEGKASPEVLGAVLEGDKAPKCLSSSSVLALGATDPPSTSSSTCAPIQAATACHDYTVSSSTLGPPQDSTGRQAIQAHRLLPTYGESTISSQGERSTSSAIQDPGSGSSSRCPHPRAIS